MFGASSELDPDMFGASSELASVMEFGFYPCSRALMVTSVSQLLPRALFTGVQK